MVYLSGTRLSDNVSTGNGGPVITFFNSTTNCRYDGHVVLTDDAIDSYLFAHEAAHVLFGRILNNNAPESFSTNDPSNPGHPHNNNPQNIMFPIIPASNPFINSAQCIVASESKVVVNDNASVIASGNNANIALLLTCLHLVPRTTNFLRVVIRIAAATTTTKIS